MIQQKTQTNGMFSPILLDNTIVYLKALDRENVASCHNESNTNEIWAEKREWFQTMLQNTQVLYFPRGPLYRRYTGGRSDRDDTSKRTKTKIKTAEDWFLKRVCYAERTASYTKNRGLVLRRGSTNTTGKRFYCILDVKSSNNTYMPLLVYGVHISRLCT